MELPLVEHVNESTGAVTWLRYPAVRIWILVAAIVIGVAMWLALNRTTVGMLVRAGVDDRDMLAATGVRIQLVFLVVFAFGAGLAGIAGVVGGTFQSLSPGEDTRFLLACLVVVIVGGMGSIVGAAFGALIIGLAEQFGSVYMPTYAIVAHLPHHGGGAGVAAAGPSGNEALTCRSSIKPSLRRPRRPADVVRRIPAPWWIVGDPADAADRRQRLLAVPDHRLDFDSRHDRAQPDVPRRLWRHGEPGADDDRRDRRLHGRDPRRRRGQCQLGLSWWIVLPVAILIATLFGTLSGALAVRTEGIYTIMITLAIASAFYYFTRQNYTIFNGYSGFNVVLPPKIFGVDWRDPVPFYYLTLGCAVLSYGAVVYVARAPFGLALQGVRDNPRRMAALGFNVIAHRIAAYAFASVFASTGGVLLVWQNAQISPGTVGVSSAIDMLIIAVVGGMSRPIGPFIGAFIYVLLQAFSLDILASSDSTAIASSC